MPTPGAGSSSPSRTSPKAAGSRSSTASPTAVSGDPGRPPPRSDERRQPQPQRADPGRRRRGGRSRRWSGRRGRRRRDRHGAPDRRAPADRGRRRHPVRAARRHDDGRVRSSSPARSAARIAERFDLPVYLYARAAMRPDRVGWPTSGAASTRASRTRSRRTGPASRTSARRGPIPTAGAVAVGARPFLIAYNINLASTDLELAKRIARTIRESGGGLPAVQANGFWIEELGCAQVSMNLLDFTRSRRSGASGRRSRTRPGGRASSPSSPS